MRRGEPQPLVDKLILRTGLEPGAAMVMMDLYASGSHAHLEKGPSIAYFEADGVPLFHNMGRHGTASAITGNILWAMPGNSIRHAPRAVPHRCAEYFPGCWNRADEWFTMAIPTEYLARRRRPLRGRPRDAAAELSGAVAELQASFLRQPAAGRPGRHAVGRWLQDPAGISTCGK